MKKSSIPNKNKVSKRGVGGKRYSSGIGYIIIPENIDRDSYIANSIKNGTISFATENAERFDNIKISKNLINYLDFPIKYNELGSQIFFNIIPLINLPIVIGVLTKSGEVNLMLENSFEISRKTEDASVSIIGDGKKGNLSINIDSFQEKGGELNINVNNKNNSAKVKVAVNGKIEVEATDEISLTSMSKFSLILLDPKDSTKNSKLSYEKGKGLIYLDEFENLFEINKDNIKISPKSKLNIGEGKEPLLLGKTTQTELEKDNAILGALLKAIGDVPTNAADVVFEPGNGAPSAFQAKLSLALTLLKKGDYSKILSEKSNTD